MFVGWGRGRVAPVVVFVAALAWQLARLALSPHGDPFDRVFAEDGAVFLADAHAYGWRSVFYSFAGYGSPLPRLLGLLGTRVPLESYAVYAAVTGTAVAAACAALTYVAARRVIRPAWAVAAAMVVVAVPALNLETLGVIANGQWFLMPTCAWFFLGDGRRLPWLTRAVVVVALVNAPLAVLAVPVLAVHGRRALRHPAVPAVAVGVAAQAAYVAFAPVSPGGPEREARLPENLHRELLDLTVVRLAHRPATIAALGLALLAVALLLVLVRPSRAAVLMAGSGLLAGGVPTVLSGLTGRYVGVFTTFLFGAAVIAMRDRPWGVLPPVAALVFVAAATTGFSASANRVKGTSWRQHVRDARTSCAATGWATIPVAPERWTPEAHLRC